MIDNSNIFSSEYLTNTSNYSGVFQTGTSYKKFDFVHDTGDGLFYYAKENVVYGGGAQISGANRLTLVPGGSYTSEGDAHFIVDTQNQLENLGASFEVGQIVSLQGSTGTNDGTYKILSIEKDLLSVNYDNSITGSSMTVIGLNNNDSIDTLEVASANILSLSEINISPGDNDTVWSRDSFFFDADYGSNVSFKANNHKYQYGNGYYILQPKNINSLSIEVNLKFKNRTNRESNAIVHFLENHQGQQEQINISPNLIYSQGISGFRWDESSTFHPYASIGLQAKRFTCGEWNHSLNFENSNDIEVKLRNLDSSILQKTSGLFVSPIEAYSDSRTYEKNDAVYSTGNKRHYYWSGDSSLSGFAPSQNRSEWSRAGGFYQDINTQYWTRDFFWKPSLGLSVSQKPRMQDIGVGDAYIQIFNDGINESLLTLDLDFNNRNDSEARSIIHFLEQHYGCVPFGFTPPAPYETRQNFVCQEWSHSYNFKGNHSISAKFEQYPFNLEGQQYDSINPVPFINTGELIFTSPFIMRSQDSQERLSIYNPFRSKFLLKNIGDTPIDLSYCSISGRENLQFSILGQENNDVPMVSKNLVASDYEYTLPLQGTLPAESGLSNSSSTIDLHGANIRLRKGFLGGDEGGYIFELQDKTRSFIQYNDGLIRDLGNADYMLQTNYFINYDFITGNKTSILNAQESSDIEIIYQGADESDLFCNLLDIDGDNLIYMTDTNPSTEGGNILLKEASRYYEQEILISGNYLNSPKSGDVRIYLNI
jgi:phage-related protein